MYKVTLINDSEKTVIHYPNFSEVKILSGLFRVGVNIAGDFVFNIAINNPGYHKIKPLKTLVEVLNTKTNQLEFEGRVFAPYEEMTQNGIVFNTFDCEGELAYLNDSSQRHGEYHNISVRDFLQVIIDNHNADVSDSDIDKTFQLGIVDVDSSTGELYRYLGYESTWATIKDKLIDRLGGEIRIRKENGVRYLDYLKELGEIKQTEIKLAKNLKSISREVNPNDVITRLIPLGETIESDDEQSTDASQARITIKSVNNNKDYIEDPLALSLFGPITRSVIWDDITVPSILKTRGEQYLQNNNRIKTSYQVSSLDLSLIGLDIDGFDVYNWYPVINPIMGIDEHLRVIGKTTNILDPQDSILEIGDKLITASQYQYESNRGQRKIIELETRVSNQFKTLTKIRNEVTFVETSLGDLQQAVENADLEELPGAINALEQAINNLNDALDGIPIYDLATHEYDGLMASADKVKLDSLEIYEEATELLAGLMSAADKRKLNQITVTQSIDLDDVLTRLNALENPQDP